MSFCGAFGQRKSLTECAPVIGQHIMERVGGLAHLCPWTTDLISHVMCMYDLAMFQTAFIVHEVTAEESL